MAATILSRCRDDGNLFWVDVKMGAWCNFGGKKYITVYFFPGEPTFVRRVLFFFQKKMVGTLPSTIVEHFLRTRRTPRTNINQKVKTTSKSPKHDDFVVQLIFVVFRCRFCDMSAQSGPIWLSLYCFTTSMVAKLAHNHNTTQNTTHILHNNQQNELPLYPQRLCPLSPWVGQWCPQIFASRLPMGPLQVSVLGLCTRRPVPLFGMNFNPHKK